METSRDSSAWRNLAVTFGGGLALGAVGMRLTQTALRPPESAPRPDFNPADDRIERLERRLERIERTPPATQPSAAHQIDQKVLEAVVGAVDARIQEHAGKVERRIADLEAKVAVELQALRQQGRQNGEAEKSLAEMQRKFREETLGMRSALEVELHQLARNVSAANAEHTAMRTELQTLQQQNERILDSAEQRFADMRYEYRQEMGQLRATVDGEIERRMAAGEKQMAEEMAVFRSATGVEIALEVDRRTAAVEQSIEARMITTAAAAATAQIEEQLAPLRSEVERKEMELSELRQRLADSERSVLDVILAIGQVCRQAAERVAGPAAQPPAAAEPVAPVNTASAVEGAEPETSESSGPVAVAPPAPKTGSDVPTFLQDRGRSPWRVPLVSSFLVTTGLFTTGLFLLRYL